MFAFFCSGAWLPSACRWQWEPLSPAETSRDALKAAGFISQTHKNTVNCVAVISKCCSSEGFVTSVPGMIQTVLMGYRYSYCSCHLLDSSGRGER